MWGLGSEPLKQACKAPRLEKVLENDKVSKLRRWREDGQRRCSLTSGRRRVHVGRCAAAQTESQSSGSARAGRRDLQKKQVCPQKTRVSKLRRCRNIADCLYIHRLLIDDYGLTLAWLIIEKTEAGDDDEETYARHYTRRAGTARR